MADPTIEAGYRDAGYWDQELLTQCVTRHARSKANEIAVVDGNNRLTWHELELEARRAAGALRDKGVGERDIVSTQLPNGADIVIMHLATELLGAVHNPLAVQFREHELNQVTELLGSKVVVHPGVLDGIDYHAIHAHTVAGRAQRAFSIEAFTAGPLPVPPDLERVSCFGNRGRIHFEHVGNRRHERCAPFPRGRHVQHAGRGRNDRFDRRRSCGVRHTDDVGRGARLGVALCPAPRSHADFPAQMGPARGSRPDRQGRRVLYLRSTDLGTGPRRVSSAVASPPPAEDDLPRERPFPVSSPAMPERSSECTCSRDMARPNTSTAPSDA